MASLSTLTRRLHNRVAIVTGASSGIGRAIALAHAHHGAKVVCADLNKLSARQGEASISTADLIVQSGGTALYHEVDVGSDESVDALVSKTVSDYERLDVMINCAGIAPELKDPQPIWQSSKSSWTSTMHINTTAVWSGCRAASAQMMKQPPRSNGDRGWIINLSSIYGLSATAGNVAYCSSKHAVIGLTKAAALDCAPHRIYVNAICPGFTASALTTPLLANAEHGVHISKVQPLKGIGAADDVAKMAVVLGSDDCTWMTGVALPVDGGFLCQ